MSAINIVIQRKHQAVHILTDGLVYTNDGLITQVAQKCFAVPNLKMAVASLGAGAGASAIAFDLSCMFSSFDSMIAAAERILPHIYDDHLESFQRSEFSDVEIHLAGWSEERNQPEAYNMILCEEESAPHWGDAAFKLRPTSCFAANPLPSGEDFRDALITIPNATPDDIADKLIPDFHLLHVMEVQRRMKRSIRKGFPSRYFVGGHALLTSITRASITQQILHRWEEDQIGEHVEPKPIDWQSWCATHAPRHDVARPQHGKNGADNRATVYRSLFT